MLGKSTYVEIMSHRIYRQHLISCFVDTLREVLVSTFSVSLLPHFRMWGRLLFENMSSS